MRQLVLLGSVYALICALVLPGSILAQEEPPAPAAAPAETETTPAEAPPPAPPAEPPPAPPEPQALADETKEAPAPEPPKAIAAASGGVTIADFSFSPASLTVNQGDTVTWVNNGPTPHSATANNGSFNTGILKAGQSASHTFSQAGTFSYYCQPHPYMKATIVVQAAQTQSDTTDTNTAESTDTGATAAQAPADDGPTLPNTGGDAVALLVLGGLMLLLGFLMHRRAEPREPRPAGRIGW
jgi:LPXTG-motif cell wall-anchored protein